MVDFIIPVLNFLGHFLDFSLVVFDPLISLLKLVHNHLVLLLGLYQGLRSHIAGVHLVDHRLFIQVFYNLRFESVFVHFWSTFILLLILGFRLCLFLISNVIVDVHIQSKLIGHLLLEHQDRVMELVVLLKNVLVLRDLLFELSLQALVVLL